MGRPDRFLTGLCCAFGAAAVLLAGFAQESRPQFTDVTAAAGLAGFVNKQGTARKDYILESIGGGCAFFDYDGDGWLDVLLVRGSDLKTYQAGGEPVCALYRNHHDGTFIDVTAKSGLNARGWGMGVAIADYDGDGYDDIFITGYGRSYLFHNNGDGTFRDQAERAGVASRGLWSTGAVFLDYNRDGLPDLYVARYVTFDAGKPVPRSAQCQYKGLGVFCGPQGFRSDPHSLYRNNGDGTFTDVSAAAGIRAIEGPAHGLGVIGLDYDNDGWPDIYVANDSSPNLLWRSLGNGRFANAAVAANAAFSADGLEQASMGADAGDLENRGLLDIFLTNFSGQGSELYRNSPAHLFEDDTWQSGIAKPSLPYLGWSAHMADFDGDGWLDILAVNGHVYPEVDRQPVGTSYRQKLLLFRRTASKHFESIGDRLGNAFQEPRAARGAALGDFDNDGDLDILINNMDGPPVLLRNDGVTAGTWLQVELAGKINRDALGARVYIRARGLTQMREISSASGYLSSSSRRAQFSLGTSPRAEELRIVWPGGKQTVLHDVAGNRLIRVREE
jgi:hypothetical protein